MEPWPNFFIVGAPRAGTTSLYEYLKQHPKIFMPELKEPSYFSKNILDDRQRPYVRTKKEYLDLFKNGKSYVAIGEATVEYLSDPDSPYLIHKEVPNAKIIISLRDPTVRGFSEYLDRVRTGREKLSFREVIHTEAKRIGQDQQIGYVIGTSLYSQHIQRYFDVFGNKNVKIIIFEEFILDVKEKVYEILEFLGVEKNSFDFEEKVYGGYIQPLTKLGKLILSNSTGKKRKILDMLAKFKFLQNRRKFLFSKNQKKAKILLEDRKFLEKVFFEDAQKTQKILGRSIPWPFLKK